MMRRGLLALLFVASSPVHASEGRVDPMKLRGAAGMLRIHGGLQVSWGVASIQGRRSYQEDRFVVQQRPGTTPQLFFAVYDGHGGDRTSTYLESNMHATVFSDLPPILPPLKDIQAAIVESFLRVDRNLRPVAEANRHHPRDGSTACTILVHGDELLCANAGDSRAVLALRGQTQAVALSDDHSPELPRELERIEKTGGWVKNGRFFGNMLNVARGLGDFFYKNQQTPQKEQWVSPEPDTLVHETRTAEFAIIATDGLWDVLSNDEAIEVVRKVGYSDASVAAEKLVHAAYALGSTDNITAVVIVFQPTSTPRAKL
eukprot:TRINITY_DN8348_c0_g1_i1.p1 TRINITY_DN8348_c0_g1~~TRINITY_DN8348_c0_g1_i1.p1  ORF type:complete len:316 (+),score=52.97 TRINITY_DN8348_c0_g1_i1:3-950(+)